MPPPPSTLLHLSDVCQLVAGVSVKGWFLFVCFDFFFKAGPQVAQSGLGLAVC